MADNVCSTEKSVSKSLSCQDTSQAAIDSEHLPGNTASLGLEQPVEMTGRDLRLS